MYGRVFDEEWESVSYEEALRRMYVLGVATALGHPNSDEYDRLRRQASISYARSVLELSFEEGQSRARRSLKEHDGDEEVWSSLVDEAADPSPSGIERHDRRLKHGLPEAVAQVPFLDIERDELARLRLPDMLRLQDGSAAASDGDR